jgi:hypothetical protein
MIDNSANWIKRAKEMLDKQGAAAHHDAGTEYSQFASSMVASLYGKGSAQMKQFDMGFAAAQGNATKQGRSLDLDLHHYARGVIKNVLAELEAGLIVNLRVAVEGEVLGEMVALGRDVLSTKSDDAKNVAAVLLAAISEGPLLKMGEEFAGVTTRPTLKEVIGALKTADVLKGGQIATALGFLKFRNDSLHADWANVDRSQVESCLAFSESLLLKHFS